MDASLRDRTVLLHGATGALGGALLAQLGSTGARVGAVVRRRWQVADVERALDRAGVTRDRQLVGVVDSDDGEAASGFVKGIEDSLGPIAAMVSAAGAFAFARVGEDDAAVAVDLWRANFLSVHTLVRAVVPPMRRRRAGVLLFVGARAVRQPPEPGLALYRASKAALHAYAECLATEVAAHGMRVHVLAPGVLDTAANRQAMPEADRTTWLDPAALARQLLAMVVSAPAGVVIDR